MTDKKTPVEDSFQDVWQVMANVKMSANSRRKMIKVLNNLEAAIVKKVLPKNKYSREIKPGVWVDVYDVLRAFPTGCSAMDHAAKKVLAAGKRGHKDTITDKKDIIASVKRSMEQDAEWAV